MKAVAVIGNPKAASRTHDAAEHLAAAVGRARTADVVIAACPAQGRCQLDSTCTTDDSPARRTGRWGPTVPDTAKARTAR
ncbi:hypothetical protein ABT075_03440 [Streptomyces sp. NPDC002677]|uniref:hypothetical protein n=1 Tax=Streptomyces sp. NPDC002677 TaxID=3154774 RepID=UPI003326249F